MGRNPCCSKEGLNRGAWTALEDNILISYVETHGEGKWRSLPLKAGLKRCCKSCRLRWRNYLRPDIKRGNISEQEEDLIIRLHKLLGNRWSLIAGRLPGRTDNEIKNYWNTIISKKVRSQLQPPPQPCKSRPEPMKRRPILKATPPAQVATCSLKNDNTRGTAHSVPLLMEDEQPASVPISSHPLGSETEHSSKNTFQVASGGGYTADNDSLRAAVDKSHAACEDEYDKLHSLVLSGDDLMCTGTTLEDWMESDWFQPQTPICGFQWSPIPFLDLEPCL